MPAATEVSSPALSTRAWAPREHALWGWLAVPAVATLILSPAPATLAATLTVLFGFGASNALRRVYANDPGARPAAQVAAAAAGLSGVAALALAVRPWAIGVQATLGGVALWLLVRSQGKIRRNPWLEAGGIAGLAVMMMAAAVAGGAPIPAVTAVGGLLVAWQVIGLAWINQTLARVLPKRVAWPDAPMIALFAVIVAAATALVAGHAPLVPLLLLYTLRVRWHAPIRAAAEAKRLGLTELAWGVGVALVAAQIAVA